MAHFKPYLGAFEKPNKIRKQKSRGYTITEYKRIGELYNAGSTIKELMELTGKSNSVIRNILQLKKTRKRRKTSEIIRLTDAEKWWKL